MAVEVIHVETTQKIQYEVQPGVLFLNPHHYDSTFTAPLICIDVQCQPLPFKCCRYVAGTSCIQRRWMTTAGKTSEGERRRSK